MLHDLLKIKRIREKSAQDEVRKCRHHLDAARAEVLKREQELEEYKIWRYKEEQRLYDNIINTEVKQNDLSGLKAKVANLRAKDFQLEQAIDDAKGQVVKAEQTLAAAEEAYRKAMQATKKFEEFTRVLDEEKRKEQERLEELELEEFTVKPNHF
ncbi:type III secretion system stalk subunit SctO [Spongorhabdus nitratireducens]